MAILAELFYNFKDIVMGPNIDERRLIPRARCSIALSCQTPDGAIVCILKDLSTKGARILTDQNCRKGLPILLVAPKGSGEQAKAVKGKVAWSRSTRDGYLIGIQFNSPPDSWVTKVLRELGLTSTVPTQQRKFVRVPGDTVVEIFAQGFTKKANLRDLSIGGALVHGDDKFLADLPVRLTIPASAGVVELELSGRARTCRKQTNTSGYQTSIKFDVLSPSQRKQLVKHLSHLMRRSLSS